MLQGPRSGGRPRRAAPNNSFVSGKKEQKLMARYVGAVDQGTTSTRFMVFDHAGREVARHQMEHEQILPRAGLGGTRPCGNLPPDLRNN